MVKGVVGSRAPASLHPLFTIDHPSIPAGVDFRAVPRDIRPLCGLARAGNKEE